MNRIIKGTMDRIMDRIIKGIKYPFKETKGTNRTTTKGQG